MRQEQTMTHQQIQALEMLFLPVLELQAMIDAEIEKNPVLETEGDIPDAPQDNSDNDEWLENILKLEEESRYIKSGPTRKFSAEDEERRRHYLESITSEQTFQEFLLDQLRFMEINEEIRSCCEVVISGPDFLQVKLYSLICCGARRPFPFKLQEKPFL